MTAVFFITHLYRLVGFSHWSENFVWLFETLFKWDDKKIRWFRIYSSSSIVSIISRLSSWHGDIFFFFFFFLPASETHKSAQQYKQSWGFLYLHNSRTCPWICLPCFRLYIQLSLKEGPSPFFFSENLAVPMIIHYQPSTHGAYVSYTSWFICISSVP